MRFERVNVAHSSTNRAQHRLTTLTKANALPIHQTTTLRTQDADARTAERIEILSGTKTLEGPRNTALGGVPIHLQKERESNKKYSGSDSFLFGRWRHYTRDHH